MKYPYVQSKSEGRRIDQHRAIMERAVGRRLGRFEFVHHVNGNKRDNRIENLELVSPKVHAIRHNQWKHPKIKTCPICGKRYEPSPTKRARSKTCSRKCGLLLLSLKNRRPSGRFSSYRPDAPPSRAKIRKQVGAQFVKAFLESERVI